MQLYVSVTLRQYPDIIHNMISEQAAQGQEPHKLMTQVSVAGTAQTSGSAAGHAQLDRKDNAGGR